MATFLGNKIEKLFPLKSIGDVIQLFRQQLEQTDEPDLTLLSIVTGIVENTLTSRNVKPAVDKELGGGTDPKGSFPIIELPTVIEFYEKFQKLLSIVEDRKAANLQYATREIIKKISDVIWNSLIRSTYKDRAHLQSLYSYLGSFKLDCFGVAFCVIAGCQLLGYNDVHLAISEDHAWALFGATSDDTIEITWHGKGTEDKRGQSVITGYESHSWLYLSGNPVVCDRYMEVAAIVSSINPALNMTSTCSEVADLQQQLLWLLYDLKHLNRYPMALGCLGELEEVHQTPDRTGGCEILYAEAIRSAQRFYKNHHVYPYTYQGAYYYRHIRYKDAFHSWANAGDVIRLYNYSRDDEEIYKEFLEIANEWIPLIMKTESSGHSARSVLRDANCFANLLRFYDGICQWEEGSQTPILHIGWAKPLVTTISRFDCDIRSQVQITCSDDSKSYCLIDGKSESNNNVMLKDPKVPKPDDSLIPTLEALTAACGEKILNPNFLLQGGGQPFADQSDKKVDNGESSTVKEMVVTETIDKIDVAATEPVKLDPVPVKDDDGFPERPAITLYSQKMKGLKDLLLAEKLNTHAISLQVTAQSQVQVGGKKGRHFPFSVTATSKRARRD